MTRIAIVNLSVRRMTSGLGACLRARKCTILFDTHPQYPVVGLWTQESCS
ncbi:Uncharacterised protein [Lautropia mirabilis]|nr:Uncharacterised protein [Lautropia mirabilis]